MKFTSLIAVALGAAALAGCTETRGGPGYGYGGYERSSTVIIDSDRRDRREWDRRRQRAEWREAERRERVREDRREQRRDWREEQRDRRDDARDRRRYGY